jgi:hypothetical protein
MLTRRTPQDCRSRWLKLQLNASFSEQEKLSQNPTHNSGRSRSTNKTKVAKVFPTHPIHAVQGDQHAESDINDDGETTDVEWATQSRLATLSRRAKSQHQQTSLQTHQSVHPTAANGQEVPEGKRHTKTLGPLMLDVLESLHKVVYLPCYALVHLLVTSGSV